MLRTQAAMAWFRWEMGVSSFSLPDPYKSDNDEEEKEEEEEADHTEPELLVWKPSSSGWFFQNDGNNNGNYSGRRRSGSIRCGASEAAEATFKLRRWSQKNTSLVDDTTTSVVNKPTIPSTPTTTTTTAACREIRQVEYNSTIKTTNNNNSRRRLPKDFLPVQAMLTCFYSVNNEYLLSDFNLLSKSRMDRIRHIPCIAVQGAQDLICPPDTALDLHGVWPEMELRIVCRGKHSMYDPSIAAQLVKATDQMGGTL